MSRTKNTHTIPPEKNESGRKFSPENKNVEKTKKRIPPNFGRKFPGGNWDFFYETTGKFQKSPPFEKIVISSRFALCSF
jgi:hypothetical protein